MNAAPSSSVFDAQSAPMRPCAIAFRVIREGTFSGKAGREIAGTGPELMAAATPHPLAAMPHRVIRDAKAFATMPQTGGSLRKTGGSFGKTGGSFPTPFEAKATETWVLRPKRPLFPKLISQPE
ncbi:MAG: hypothetical protein ABI318_21240 [Chthoniobacteraceae bacterium]